MVKNKKRNVALIFSSISICISLLALLLSYISYFDSKSKKFIWDVSLDAGIPTTIQSQESYLNDSLFVDYSLTIWVQCDITNSGRNTFSVNSITEITYNYDIEHISKFAIADWNLYKPSSFHGNVPEERVIVPFTVEPGHTKRVVSKINLDISNKLYEKLKLEFKDKNLTFGDIRRLSNNVQKLKLIEKYIIFFDVNLSNGKTKRQSVDIWFYNW